MSTVPSHRQECPSSRAPPAPTSSTLQAFQTRIVASAAQLIPLLMTESAPRSRPKLSYSLKNLRACSNCDCYHRVFRGEYGSQYPKIAQTMSTNPRTFGQTRWKIAMISAWRTSCALEKFPRSNVVVCCEALQVQFPLKRSENINKIHI